MSIRILLDHGVQQDHIIFVTFLVARGGGISVIRRAFPDVRIVCGAVDDEMAEGWLDDEQSVEHGRQIWVMQPGMGQIGTQTDFSVDKVLILVQVIVITSDVLGLHGVAGFGL